MHLACKTYPNQKQKQMSPNRGTCLHIEWQIVSRLSDVPESGVGLRIGDFPVLTETSMNCNELLNTHIFLDAFIRRYFQKLLYPSLWYNLWSICSHTISLSHPLSFLHLSLICSWFSNKPPQKIINNPISLLNLRLPFFENNHASYIKLDLCSEKCLFLKYFKNNFKRF